MTDVNMEISILIDNNGFLLIQSSLCGDSRNFQDMAEEFGNRVNLPFVNHMVIT